MPIGTKDPGFFLFTVAIGREAALSLPAKRVVPCYARHEVVDRHDNHEMHVVLDGSGWFRLGDGSTLTITAGQVVLLPSHVVHQFFSDTAVYLWSCELSPQLFAQLGARQGWDATVRALATVNAGLPPRVTSDPYFYDALLELFKQAMTEYARDDTWRADSLSLLGQLIAINTHRLMSAPATPHGDPTAIRLLRVKAWMDRHFCEPVTLPALAAMAHLSASHFAKLFQQQVGVTPKTYLMQRRLQQAAMLLAATDLSITDIAASVGFDYLANFTHTFNDAFHETPSAYRRKHQKNRENYEDTPG